MLAYFEIASIRFMVSLEVYGIPMKFRNRRGRARVYELARDRAFKPI